MRRFALGAVLACLAWPCCAAAGDWPQWLGPNRDGTSTEVVTPWTSPPAAAWKVAVGEGHSSPVVAGGRVYLHYRVPGMDLEELAAFAVADGKKLWSDAYERAPYTNQFGNGPRATPLVAQGRVFTFGVTGILTAWDADTGRVIWRRDLVKEFNAPIPFFGVSSSPLLVADHLLVMAGGPGASLVGLDPATGKTRWQTGDDKPSYSSPMTIRQGDRTLAVFLTAAHVVAVDPATGKEAWKVPLVDKLNESSTTPVRFGDQLFASSVTFGGVALKLGETAGQPSVAEAWKNLRLNCYFGTPVAVDRDLYVVTGTLLPPGGAHLHGVDGATGSIRWTRKNVGKYHATLLKTPTHLLMLEEAGDLVLLEPNPKEYRETCRAKVCGTTWAHPALADGRFFIRDAKELIAVKLK